MSKRVAWKETYFTCLMPPQGIAARFNEIAAAAPADAECKHADDLHITLNYLQKPRKRSVRDLIERLSRVEFPAFDVKLADMDAFYRIPRRDMNTHVVWMRPDGASAWRIKGLHAKILLSLRPVGYAVGSTSITPHMTALKYPFHAAAEPLEAFIERNADLKMPVWHCSEFILARSKMRDDPTHPANNNDQGGKYEIIGRFPLKAPGAV